MNFDTYKSEVCHYVKRVGDLKAINELSNDNQIITLFQEKDYQKCLYLLGMLDYLCKKHNMDYVSRFDDLRKYKLEMPLFPSGAVMLYLVTKDKSYLTKAVEGAEYEFKKFNIIEGEIENVA